MMRANAYHMRVDFNSLLELSSSNPKTHNYKFISSREPFRQPPSKRNNGVEDPQSLTGPPNSQPQVNRATKTQPTKDNTNSCEDQPRIPI
jgi:hypothetical protein